VTDDEKVKAREREAKVAQLARELYGRGVYHKPTDCFLMAELFIDYAELRWEELK